jgi:hypothetical protein
VLLQGECHEVDSRQQCERKTIKLVNKGRYAQWSMPTRNIAECNVPSVRGMLGRVSTVAKVRGEGAEADVLQGAGDAVCGARRHVSW